MKTVILEPKKVLLIGIDQAIPYLLKKFVDEGILPSINRLLEGGVYTEAYSCPPCDTPTNWATIATGATTAVHGATSFYLHIPGEPLDFGLKYRSRTQLSQHCTAEYIWDVAERHGARPFVINYPAGWPSNFKEGAMSLLTWPIPDSLPRVISYPRTLSYSASSTDPTLQISRADEPGAKIESHTPLLQITMQIKTRFSENLQALKVYLVDTLDQGYNSLTLSIGKENKWSVLKEEEWSNWIPLDIATKHGILPCLFKLKALELAGDGSTLKIQTTSIYNTKGWTNPEDLGEKIVKNAIIYELAKQQKVEYIIKGKMKPYLLNARREAVTLARAINYARVNLGWRMCFFHIHLLDSVNHRSLAILYEDSPFHTEKAAKKAMEYVRTAYKIVDELVETLIKTCVDEETIVVFISDHGALPSWKIANIPLALMRAGLLSYKWNSNNQKFIVNWDKTLAFPYLEPPYIWVNLKGREPHGIVNSTEYESVRERVVQALYQMNDPETGARIIKLALKREEAAFLGQNGKRVGDVVYFLNPPYQLFDGNLEQLNAAEQPPELLVKAEAFNAQVNFAAHAYYLPTAKLGNYTISVPLIMTGPSIKKNIELKRPINLIDVAPTLAHLLQIPTPRNSQGRVIHELLE